MTDEIVARREGSAGLLTLNRPKAVHALNTAMVEAMADALLDWRDDARIETVLIEHGDGRGFCAGGDVAMVRRSVLADGGADGRAFFRAEYRLNHQLFTYPKTVVAFMDGITMGGGVGISRPARFCVATENTVWAMPEMAIGLFPDVGAGWYLSRLGGRLGQFLALTGARLDGAECLWSGLASHYLTSDRLADAKARIATGGHADQVLAELAAAAPRPRLADNAERIDRHFASDRLEDILASLGAAASGDTEGSAWAAKELATLRSKSPQACKIALRQLAQAATLADFTQEMVIEYALAARVITRPDFAEGVRAVLVDKDNAPTWNPATPEGVTQALLDELFAPLPPGEAWSALV